MSEQIVDKIKELVQKKGKAKDHLAKASAQLEAIQESTEQLETKFKEEFGASIDKIDSKIDTLTKKLAKGIAEAEQKLKDIRL